MKKILFSALALAAVASGSAQTVNNLVVTEKDGQTKRFPTEEIQAVLFEPAPEYQTLTNFLDSSYEETSTTGLYRIEFGTGDPDQLGNPENIGDMQVALLLSAPWTDNVTDPQLPTGYFRAGNGTDQYTFDISKSAIWVRLEDGPEGITSMMIIDGTVDIRPNGDDFDIRMEFTDMIGQQYAFRYQGGVWFDAGYSDYKPFDTDLNIDFQIGQGRFYNNWYYPLAADLTLQFYVGTIQSGVMTDGYELTVSMYEPKPENEMDPNQNVADGVYKVDFRDAINYTYVPFTYQAGERTSFMGQEFITKTRLEYVGADGTRRLGLITDGTMTVSNNGSNFLFDFTTEDGIHITGKFDGRMNIQNFCDNDEKAPQPPFSTLTEDVTLNFRPETVAMTFNEGQSIIQEANTFMLAFAVPEFDRGDYLSFDLFCDGETLKDGEYIVDGKLESGHALPGCLDYARQMMFSWYGDLSKIDEEGYNTWMGPINGGSVTVSTTEFGQRHFIFNLLDDNGHKITGEFTGFIFTLEDTSSAAARKMKKRAASRKFIPNLR